MTSTLTINILSSLHLCIFDLLSLLHAKHFKFFSFRRLVRVNISTVHLFRPQGFSGVKMFKAIEHLFKLFSVFFRRFFLDLRIYLDSSPLKVWLNQDLSIKVQINCRICDTINLQGLWITKHQWFTSIFAVLYFK